MAQRPPSSGLFADLRSKAVIVGNPGPPVPGANAPGATTRPPANPPNNGGMAKTQN